MWTCSEGMGNSSPRAQTAAPGTPGVSTRQCRVWQGTRERLQNKQWSWKHHAKRHRAGNWRRGRIAFGVWRGAGVKLGLVSNADSRRIIHYTLRSEKQCYRVQSRRAHTHTHTYTSGCRSRAIRLVVRSGPTVCLHRRRDNITVQLATATTSTHLSQHTCSAVRGTCSCFFRRVRDRLWIWIGHGRRRVHQRAFLVDLDCEGMRAGEPVRRLPIRY